MARGCPKLKRFSSRGCKCVNNNAVICLATYCKQIEVLNLQNCDVSSEEGGKEEEGPPFNFPTILDNNRCSHPKNIRRMHPIEEIVRFEMSRTDGSHVDGIGSTQSAFEYFGSSWLSSIYRFRISSFGKGLCVGVVHQCGRLTWFLVKFQNCKYLERMDLEECNQITDLTLAHLATGCPSLEKLVSSSMRVRF